MTAARDMTAGLDAVWIVRDPGMLSMRVDCIFKAEVAHLDRYIFGCGPGVWASEHHAIHATEESANADVAARFAAREELRVADSTPSSAVRG